MICIFLNLFIGGGNNTKQVTLTFIMIFRITNFILVRGDDILMKEWQKSGNMKLMQNLTSHEMNGILLYVISP